MFNISMSKNKNYMKNVVLTNFRKGELLSERKTIV